MEIRQILTKKIIWKSSLKPLSQVQSKSCQDGPWMVLYKVTVFRSSRIFNMAAKANNML